MFSTDWYNKVDSEICTFPGLYLSDLTSRLYRDLIEQLDDFCIWPDPKMIDERQFLQIEVNGLRIYDHTDAILLHITRRCN